MKERDKHRNNNLWVGSEDLNGSEELIERSQQEFYELPAEEGEEAGGGKANRRDFMKYLGFGIGSAVIAASCETPVRRALPYVTKPDTIVPGVATYYASAHVRGGEFCPIVVKTREGRPIKIEGNLLSSMTKGGTSARAQASVLELYDRTRIKTPGKIVNSEGKFDRMSWADVDKAISDKLQPGSSVRIVSNTVISPTTLNVIKDFKKKYNNTEHISYDPVSFSALLDAQKQSTGQRIVPDYDFSAADMIVSFGADFLGTWNSAVEYASGYASKRKIDAELKPNMSRFYMVESHMSLSGSNADNRVMIRPSEKGVAIAYVHDKIASRMGGASVKADGTFSEKSVSKNLDAMAADLVNAKANGKVSMVISDSNNLAEQLLINHINEMLGNIGKTVKYGNYSKQHQGDDKAMIRLISDMKAGTVDVVIFLDDVNPAYDLPEGKEFVEALKNVSLKVSTTQLPNETMGLCDYVCPSHHNLETWGDAEPKKGFYSILQPTIYPIFDTRNKESSLMKWAGNKEYFAGNGNAYYNYIKKYWEKNIFPKQSEYSDFRTFWDMTVHNGVLEIEQAETFTSSTSVSSLGSKISTPATTGLEIDFYENVNIGNGAYANNPWLQEMPDPLMKTVWDNFITIPIRWSDTDYFVGMNRLGSGDIATISKGNKSLKMTVSEAFGQEENSVGIALGYGRTLSGEAGTDIGHNAYPLLSRNGDGYVQYYTSQAKLSEKQGNDESFASVQYHNTYGLKGKSEGEEYANIGEKAAVVIVEGYEGGIVDRSVIRQTDQSLLEEAVKELSEEKEEAAKLNSHTMYPTHEKLYGMGHKWEMSIDLSACIGCGACQVACIAENNVPIVGKREVRRHHEMTWLRIDRYYYGDIKSPNVVYQPMMCQHCDNAPCENVCPVGATTHSSEGINQMAYNRCIGTRYCANNCPYKVRRFNWLDYTAADLFGVNEHHPLGDEDGIAFYADNLTRMVLNPDVTVRSRGVMEKCSFCVQRIQEGKLAAKNENRPLQDGEILTACATACPTGAIVFGDVSDKGTEITNEVEDPRYYTVLMEMNTRPGVGYKMKVLNRNAQISNAEQLEF